MENVVTVLFEVESEAYQAFTNLRKVPFGEGFVVGEAALVKRTENVIQIADAFDAVGVTSDDTAAGLMLGSLVGVLGGPIGVLLGAHIGRVKGSMLDAADAADSLSMLEASALKLYDNEVAIIALVQEDEPAFDAAFEGFNVTIIRQFATDVFDEVERAREIELEIANQVRELLRAERKAARAEYREDIKSRIKARFEAAAEKIAAKKAELADAVDIANAQFVSSTNEILGE